ncbi:MAG: cobalt-precorrin-5B (C(1))-methyltransferase [Proteobacteria bacterium]|nr:cobalt-precorrin-5B (C(1))-methyltransferase [Pseudomonadota bacterium]
MKIKKGKSLRSGFTTGTCAAAGAKAAAQALFASLFQKKPVLKKAAQKRGVKRRLLPPSTVIVTLPGGRLYSVKVKKIELEGSRATATIIKDAGDDPDVTHKAAIVTSVELKGFNAARTGVSIKGGVGVGKVTRPGLKVPVGRPAINPVPTSMIRTAVTEAASSMNDRNGLKPSVEVTVSVPRGETLAKKTMNARLGILGGISILGTTGIVEPLSLAAYKDSIKCGIDVAVAAGLDTVIFSTGRSTEKVLETESDLPAAAFVMTGDHMGFALSSVAKKKEIKNVTVAGQFGKFTKLAAGHFETHCADSSIDLAALAKTAAKGGAGRELSKRIAGANTAREVFFILEEHGLSSVLKKVARMVKKNGQQKVGKSQKVTAVLVGYDATVTARV